MQQLLLVIPLIITFILGAKLKLLADIRKYFDKNISNKRENLVTRPYKLCIMTFKEAYLEKKNLPTPGQEFIARIASATCRKVSTVQQWLSGIQNPSEEAKTRISEVLGFPVNELFPQDEETQA